MTILRTVAPEPTLPSRWWPTWALRILTSWRFEALLAASNAWTRCYHELEHAEKRLRQAENYLNRMRLEHDGAERRLAARLAGDRHRRRRP